MFDRGPIPLERRLNIGLMTLTPNVGVPDVSFWVAKWPSRVVILQLLYMAGTKKASGTPSVVGLERVMGIEPTSKAWEALVLPLNYTREWTQPSSMNSCTQPSASDP